MKQDFTNRATSMIENAIAQTESEIQESKDAQKKDGRGRPPKTKTEETHRLNIEFNRSNYVYVKTMAMLSNIPLTEYINELVTKEREENKTISKLIDQLNKKAQEK